MKIIYQAGNVTGGYAFSANNEEITLSGYVENLTQAEQEVIIFEASKARELYVSEVARKKAAGEKVNPLTIKRESVASAKEAAQEKFGEELYNSVQKIVEDNKGGVQSVTGKSKPKTEKAPKTSKKPEGKAPKSKVPSQKEIPADLDLDDLEREFQTEPADEFDADFDMDEIDVDPDEPVKSKAAKDPFDDEEI